MGNANIVAIVEYQFVDVIKLIRWFDCVPDAPSAVKVWKKGIIVLSNLLLRLWEPQTDCDDDLGCFGFCVQVEHIIGDLRVLLSNRATKS